MKKMKKAIVVTITVTLVYVIALTLLGSVPVEKSLTIYSSNFINIKLPFDVSAWWSLLLCPLIILFIIYGYSRDAILGKKPEHNEKIEQKYHTRHMIYMMNFVSILLSLMFMVMVSLAWLISETIYPGSTDGFGPVSSFSFSVIVYFVVYIGGGVWEQFVFTLMWDTFMDENNNSLDELFSREENLWLKLKSTTVGYVKVGILKSFPLLLGMVLGFIARFILLQIMKLIKFLKVSLEKKIKVL